MDDCQLTVESVKVLLEFADWSEANEIIKLVESDPF